MTSETHRELQRLLSVLCDGALDDAQHSRLEELLDADAECRRCYLEYLDMHARLLQHPRLSRPAHRSTTANEENREFPFDRINEGE